MSRSLPSPQTRDFRANPATVGPVLAFQAPLASALKYTRRRPDHCYFEARGTITRLPSMTNWQVKDITPEASAKARSEADLKTAA